MLLLRYLPPLYIVGSTVKEILQRDTFGCDRRIRGNRTNHTCLVKRVVPTPACLPSLPAVAGAKPDESEESEEIAIVFEGKIISLPTARRGVYVQI